MMSLRKIDDEQFSRTYYIEPVYANDDDDADRRPLVRFRLSHVEEDEDDGGTRRLEGDEANVFVPRVWEMIRADDSLLESLERPLSAFDEIGDAVSHLQRMRELRRRLMIRKALDQDVG